MIDNSTLYITGIKTQNHPHIRHKSIDIQIPGDKKKNIIITGRNGCGKSTLLREIKTFISSYQTDQERNHIPQRQRLAKIESQLETTVPDSSEYTRLKEEQRKLISNLVSRNSLTDVICTNPSQLKDLSHILGYFEAKRMTSLSSPASITVPRVSYENIGKLNAGQEFIQHLINQRSQLSFAKEDGSHKEAKEIEEWFNGLNSLFSELFGEPLKLKFIRKPLLDFVLEKNSGEQIDLKTLSDGYSAIVNMITEIIIRMESVSFGSFNIGGIVLIDEVETHLHVELQREVLRFLFKMFPNIQFIVTTHSPFVLSSVEDALIVDLETGDAIDQSEGLWRYSYEALVEGYFEVKKFSRVLEKKIADYESLALRQNTLSRQENREFRTLKKELENVPTYKNQAIEMKLKTLGLK